MLSANYTDAVSQPMSATPSSSARTAVARAITGRMSQNEPTAKKSRHRSDRGRVRPAHAAAQLLLRMSRADREMVHEEAGSVGLTASEYVLGLVARDRAARRASAALSVDASRFRNAEEPDPIGPGSHAEAGRAVAAAAC